MKISQPKTYGMQQTQGGHPLTILWTSLLAELLQNLSCSTLDCPQK